MNSAAGGVSTGSSAPNQSFPARYALFYRHFRATIKTILASPESRRIYFFLCLNLGFMFIQMAYGIWTNSLGLISDCASPPCLAVRTRLNPVQQRSTCSSTASRWRWGSLRV